MVDFKRLAEDAAMARMERERQEQMLTKQEQADDKLALTTTQQRFETRYFAFLVSRVGANLTTEIVSKRQNAFKALGVDELKTLRDALDSLLDALPCICGRAATPHTSPPRCDACRLG